MGLVVALNGCYSVTSYLMHFENRIHPGKDERMNKRPDGLYKKSFSFNGHLHYVYGHTVTEVTMKEIEKRKELEEMKNRRDNPTLDQYHDRWTDARRGTIKESTLRCQHFQYQSCAAVVISTTGLRLGDMKLKEITPDDIREVQRDLSDGSNSSQTVNDKIAVLSHIFNTAVKERVLDYNPCSPIKTLKRKEERARDTIHRALTQEEQETFFREAEKSFYYDTFKMAVLTGMRCGEIGALYLSDIKGDMIHIERTITKTETGAYIIGDDAKTWHGRRTIPLNDDIIEVLEHQKYINKMLDGDKITSITDRIFKAPERGLLMSTPLCREINRICKRTGIEKFTMHALRATFATRCIEQGIDVRTLQDLLGHADYALTMNLYGHVVDTTKQAAMKRLKIVI